MGVDVPLFAEIASAVRAGVDPGVGPIQAKWTRYSVKLWVGDADKPLREHYEAQMIDRRHLDGAKGAVLEVGFHCEHPKEPENEAVIRRLTAPRASLLRALGGDAVIGPFLGRDSWRRVSETWEQFDFGDPGFVPEVADRLVTYVEVIEPRRT